MHMESFADFHKNNYMYPADVSRFVLQWISNN